MKSKEKLFLRNVTTGVYVCGSGGVCEGRGVGGFVKVVGGREGVCEGLGGGGGGL